MVASMVEVMGAFMGGGLDNVGNGPLYLIHPLYTVRYKRSVVATKEWTMEEIGREGRGREEKG
jgi:hypothetical protein